MLCIRTSDEIIKFLLTKNYESMINNLSRKNNKGGKILMKRLKWKNSLYSIFLDYLKIQHNLNRMSSVIVSQQDLNYNMIYNNVIFNSYTNLLYHYYS